MKKLQINITNAILTGFSVQLKEGKPEVDATIALLAENGKAITTYQIGTESWRGDKGFKLPVSLMPLIGDIARELEAIAVRSCQQGQKALPAPKKAREPVVVKTKDPAVILVDDQPIDLDDIPF